MGSPPRPERAATARDRESSQRRSISIAVRHRVLVGTRNELRQRQPWCAYLILTILVRAAAAAAVRIECGWRRTNEATMVRAAQGRTKMVMVGGTGKEGRARPILTVLVLAARRGLPLPLMEGRRFGPTSQGPRRDCRHRAFAGIRAGSRDPDHFCACCWPRLRPGIGFVVSVSRQRGRLTGTARGAIAQGWSGSAGRRVRSWAEES
jgi:hypothetical protein